MIFVDNIVMILFGLIDLIKFICEFVFKNLGEKFVNGLNNNECLLFIKCVFKCGIDIGGVFIVVFLYILVWWWLIIFWFV